jgi:hypothetical protein
MPHIDSLTLRSFRGESLFARPVAALTDFVRGLVERAKDRDAHLLDDAYRDVRDCADLQRMERDYDRRDPGGWGTQDWR